MIALVDSSVILRKLFGEPDQLAEWGKIREGFVSRIARVEISRVIDRCRLDGKIGDDQVADLGDELRRVMRSVTVVALSEGILDRAASAMPAVIGTLDALHLATALDLARAQGAPITLATHDRQLARAARASGLDVCGV